MNLLRQLIDANSTQDWLVALLSGLAATFILHTVRRYAIYRLNRVKSTTTTLVDDFAVELLSATRVLLVSALGIYLATRLLSLPPELAKLINHIFISLLLLQCGFWSNRALRFWLQQKFADDDSDGSKAMTRSLLTFLGRIVLWALVLLLILDNLGLNVTALIASLGIGGVAVALAVQNILGDLFASLSIAVDKPFVINDFIIVDDVMGTVEHVGLKTTRIRSLSGEQVIFSNNDLLKSRIRNYKRMQERRVVFSIGVTYDTSMEKLEMTPVLIREAIETQVDARFERAHFKALGAFSLDFEAVYYVLRPDYALYMDIQQAINLQLVRSFAQRGIDFAFPTQTLHHQGALHLAQP